MDCRGHGDSDKPHDPAFYSYDLMSSDIRAVAEAAGLSDAHVIGYSMGGHLGIQLLMEHPEAIRKLVIAGVGANYFHHEQLSATALRTRFWRPPPRSSPIPCRKCFAPSRASRERTEWRSPPACAANGWLFSRRSWANRGGRRWLSAARTIRPAGRPVRWLQRLQDAIAVTVPGRDHMSAVGDKATKASVVEFLSS